MEINRDGNLEETCTNNVLSDFQNNLTYESYDANMVYIASSTPENGNLEEPATNQVSDFVPF